MVAPQVDPVPGLAETGKLAQTEPTTSRPTASTPAATEAPQPDTANTLALPEGSSPTGPTAEDTAAPTLTTPEVNLTDDTKITKLDTETPQAPQPRKFAVLKSDSSGVRVLAPSGPAPDVAKQIALDSISYSVAGDVQLQGRAQSKAREVRVYLDNTPIAALEVDDSGAWRGALPDVDTGVFTLRIDEIDDSGNVSSRVETPFKREDPAVLQAVNEQTDDLVKAVTVQKGNTLWAIARERYGEGVLYVRVFEANRDQIRNPDLIYPGQVFAIPQK